LLGWAVRLLGAQGQRYVQLHVSKYSPLICQEVFAMAGLREEGLMKVN
jgi:hypothetical protein